MKKEERQKKYREIMKWKENRRFILGRSCCQNGICFLFDEVFPILYPDKAQFLKEYHGQVPENIISINKKMDTSAKNNAGKNNL